MPVGASLGAAAIGGIGSIVGGVIQNQGAQSAANTQRQMFDTTQANLAPFRTAGANATNMLTQQLPSLTAPIQMDEATLEQTPGYQFNLTQGLKAVQNSAAARGLGTSGAALKGAASYATGLADSTYQQQFANALQNKQFAFNALTGTAGLGENAAAATGNAATAAGSNIGNSLIAGSTGLASGIVGAGNAITNGVNQYGGYNFYNQLLAQQAARSLAQPPSNFYNDL